MRLADVLPKERMTVVAVRPGLAPVRVLAVAIAGLALLATGFLLGHLVPAEADAVEAAPAGAVDPLGDLDLSNVRLATVVEAGANERLRRTIKELRDRIGALEEEARFYRRLVAPSEAERGFRIERLTVAATPDPARYAYRLLLTQIVDRHNWIEGDVLLELSGERAGTPERHAVADLVSDEDFATGFRFLYFQEFSGEFALPEGFVPRAVSVTAQVHDDAGTRLRESFDWVVEEG